MTPDGVQQYPAWTNPALWEPQPIEDQMKSFGKKIAGRTSLLWVNDGSFSPIALYCYLKARFGRPNGLIMAARKPGTDNLIQWHYRLMCDHLRMDITGLNQWIEVALSAEGPLEPADRDKLLANIKADFAPYGNKISIQRDGLEKWTLFVNPFLRLQALVSDLRKKLLGLDLTPVVRPRTVLMKKKELDQWLEKANAWSMRVEEAQRDATCLRMITPVYAEAFINFLLFLLAKPEIKADARLYERIIRSEIDVRARSLHINCDGFKAQVDPLSKEFKDFHSVMNGRNNLLHANIDPQQLKFSEVFLDDGIPLFQEDQSLVQLVSLARIKHVEPEVALRDLATIETFRSYIAGLLDPKVVENADMLSDIPTPGWNERTGEIRAILPDSPGEMFMGGS